MQTHQINSKPIDFQTIEAIITRDLLLELSTEATQKIKNCREYLDRELSTGNNPIYGINTGFGSLYNKSISKENLDRLQKNLVMSHACGTGEEVPRDIVRLMLLLKIQGLSYGNSGVQQATVARLIAFYNHGIMPVVYQQGSLGASGDLAPLAHLALPLIGMGEVWYKGKKQDSSMILEELNWSPLELKAKEGLALLNGTQFMSAYGVSCLIRLKKLMKWADFIAAASLDGFDGRIEPFHDLIQMVRPHPGQKITAAQIRDYLRGSELCKRVKNHVQDPYSFRCIPQVHGASKDAIGYIEGVFTNEMNAVTDNPTLFPNEEMIISAGNFHGQPLALALDFMCMAAAELGSISERRTYKLVSGQRGLPPFLVADPGLNSGLMIPQYTAASIVSQNKQLCTPASVDSIDSSNGQEDHVSMGANAATKAFRVVENLERILAIELMNAAQALDFRKPLKSSPFIEKIMVDYRKEVPFVEQDRPFHPDIQKSITFLRNYEVD